MLVPFAAEGADVTKDGLFYLHKDEVVLPPNLANVIRGLSSSGSGTVSTAGSGGSFGGAATTSNAVLINLNNPAFHGVSKDTLNDLMSQMVLAVRRAGARW